MSSLILQVGESSPEHEAANEPHEFGINSPPSGRYTTSAGAPVPSVTEILKDVGLTGNFSAIPREILQRKAKIGTRVHKAIERYLENGAHDLNEAIDDTDRVRQYLRSWFAWYKGVELIPLGIEERIVTGEYAGTVDLICYLDGHLAIIDWKTRRKGTAWYDRFQTAAYACLAAASPSVPEVTRYNRGEIRRYVCALHESDKPATLHEYSDPSDYDVWHAAVRVWRARAEQGEL